MNRNQILTNARIIQGAMAAGVVFFGVVVLFIYYQGRVNPVAQDQKSVLQALSLVNAIVFVSTWLLGPFLQRTQRSARGTGSALQDLPPDVAAAQRWLTGRLLVLAPREGSAIFGLVACMIAVQSGIIRETPAYWINAVPAVAMLAYALTTFPSQADLDRAAAPAPAAPRIG